MSKERRLFSTNVTHGPTKRGAAFLVCFYTVELQRIVRYRQPSLVLFSFQCTLRLPPILRCPSEHIKPIRVLRPTHVPPEIPCNASLRRSLHRRCSYRRCGRGRCQSYSHSCFRPEHPGRTEPHHYMDSIDSRPNHPHPAIRVHQQPFIRHRDS